MYTIALNEAAHAKRWADSAADADYRVVADTGSTDETVERLTKAGVTVHQIAVRPWRFDIARNTALALIPTDVDVCLSMDMDEFLDAGWRPKLEAAWTTGTTALYCRKRPRSHINDTTPTKGFPVKNFHHRWGYYFKRPVHEQLMYTGVNEVTRDCADIVINHVQDHSKATRKQYLPLMELARKEAPHDAQICFWLGREYMWAKEHEQGVEAMECYLSLPSSTWPDERSEAMRYLARMQPEKRMLWLDKARTEASHRREIWLDLAEELYERQDWSNLFWACSNGIEKTHRTGSYLDEEHCWGFRLFDLGAIASWHLKLIDRAVQWQQKAVELAPNDYRLRLQNSLDLFTRQHKALRTDDGLATPPGLLFSKAPKGKNTVDRKATAPATTDREGTADKSSQSLKQPSNSTSVLSQLNVLHEFERLDLTGPTQPTVLCEIVSSNGSDKAGPFHNYTIFYERLFSKFRDEKLEIFELGIGTNKVGAPSSMGPTGKPGASLRAWRAYFKSASIYGADVDGDILFVEDRIQTFWVDQTNADTIRALWRQLEDNSFDIMIDDGLHEAGANISFFLESFHKLKSGGVYVVEDVRSPDAGPMESFVHAIAPLGRCAIVSALNHPLNNSDNRLMIFQKV